MKIAFIVSQFPVLSETFILNQITGLIDRGHEVDIFAESKQKESKTHSDIEKYDLLSRTYYRHMPANKVWRVVKAIGLIISNFYKNPIVILKSLNPFKYGKKALSLELLYAAIPFLGKGSYDIIHCHFGPNGNLGAYLKQLGIQGKLVTMFHGYDIRHGIEKGGDIYHQLFKTGDCFLAISNYNYENLIQFGAPPQKIIFHPVGIDLSKFPFRWQSTNAKCPNSVKIITVARLVEEKGLQYGIHAINKLLQRHPELHLKYHIIGDGPLKEELKKLVNEQNLGEVIFFLGSMEQTEVIKEMQQAHLLLLPSIAEALPVVLMEAQAAGLPVIATSVGSIYQAIIDGKSGFLVPERDVDALAEKLEYLTEHPEIWPEMGRAGRRFVEEHYNIDKLNDQLVDIYQKLLDGELP